MRLGEVYSKLGDNEKAFQMLHSVNARASSTYYEDRMAHIRRQAQFTKRVFNKRKRALEQAIENKKKKGESYAAEQESLDALEAPKGDVPADKGKAITNDPPKLALKKYRVLAEQFSRMYERKQTEEYTRLAAPAIEELLVLPYASGILAVREVFMFVYSYLEILAERAQKNKSKELFTKVVNLVNTVFNQLSFKEEDTKLMARTFSLQAECYLYLDQLGPAYESVCLALNRNPNSMRAIQILSNVFHKSGFDVRYTRMAFRLVEKAPHVRAARLLLAHCFTYRHSYIESIAMYLRLLKEDPNCPYLHLYVGLAFLHQSLKRSCINRHLNLARSFSFMFRYLALVPPQRKAEAYYNIARSYHALNLYHLALKFYNKVLSHSAVYPNDALSDEVVPVEKSTIASEKDADNASSIGARLQPSTDPKLGLSLPSTDDTYSKARGLRASAAHNVARILVEGRADDLASELVQTYCQV